MSRFPSQKSRRARGRRDGRPDRRPSGQRQGAGGAVRPARERGAEERHRHQGHRQPEEAQAGAAGRGRRRNADPGRQLRRASGPARKNATSSSRRSPSAWTGSSICTRRSPRLSPRTPSWPPTPRACRSPSCRGAAGGDQAALLRHPLLQPAALHVPGGADRHADHPAANPGPARDLRHQRPGQGRGACQGHAQLHRQPRRHRRHAGHDEGSRELRPELSTSSTT